MHYLKNFFIVILSVLMLFSFSPAQASNNFLDEGSRYSTINISSNPVFDANEDHGEALGEKFSSIGEGESFSFFADGSIFSVEKKSGNIFVETTALSLYKGSMPSASFCATTVATIIFEIGSVALFAAAATMAPGSFLVLGGIAFNSTQVAYLASAAGSFAALQAYLDSHFCRR